MRALTQALTMLAVTQRYLRQAISQEEYDATQGAMLGNILGSLNHQDNLMRRVSVDAHAHEDGVDVSNRPERDEAMGVLGTAIGDFARRADAVLEEHFTYIDASSFSDGAEPEGDPLESLDDLFDSLFGRSDGLDSLDAALLHAPTEIEEFDVWVEEHLAEMPSLATCELGPDADCPCEGKGPLSMMRKRLLDPTFLRDEDDPDGAPEGGVFGAIATALADAMRRMNNRAPEQEPDAS